MKKAKRSSAPRSDAKILAAAKSDPDNPPMTKVELARMRRVPVVKRIRWDLELTQEAFAERFGIPLATIRDWEQGRSTPDATARSFLRAIANGPKQVAKLLEAAE